MNRRFSGALVICVSLIVALSDQGQNPAATATPQQQASDNDRAEVKDFDKFLGDHPAILPDLKRDPSLIGGDIITRINGVRLSSADEFTDALQAAEVGSSVSMTVFRDGKYFDVKYTSPERPLLPGDIPAQGAAAPLAGRGLRSGSPCCVPQVNRSIQPRN